MAGYTPVFSTIYEGSLYGRWPAAAVWASLLPLVDKNGHIDMSIPAIAGMTGWPKDLLEAGIQQLMEPDPHSRTAEHDGRRLIPLDDHRPWGWKAVNHSKYREKARLQAKDSARTLSGADAERKRIERARLDPRVPPCPPISPAGPLSDTNTNTNTNTERESGAPVDNSDAPHKTLSVLGKAWEPDEEGRRSCRERGFDVSAVLAKFRAHHKSKNTQSADWKAEWDLWVNRERGDFRDSQSLLSRKTPAQIAEDKRLAARAAKTREQFT